MNIDGACHCGSITWKAVANPDMVAICYCTDCQTFGSSAFQYTARIKRDDFELTSGQLKAMESSPIAVTSATTVSVVIVDRAFIPATSMAVAVIGSTGWLPPEGSVTSQAPNLVLLGTRLGYPSKARSNSTSKVTCRFLSAIVQGAALPP